MYALFRRGRFITSIDGHGCDMMNMAIPDSMDWSTDINEAKLYTEENEAWRIAHKHRGMKMVEVEVDIAGTRALTS